MSKAISQHEGSSRKTDLAGGKETTGDKIEKDADCPNILCRVDDASVSDECRIELFSFEKFREEPIHHINQAKSVIGLIPKERLSVIRQVLFNALQYLGSNDDQAKTWFDGFLKAIELEIPNNRHLRPYIEEVKLTYFTDIGHHASTYPVPHASERLTGLALDRAIRKALQTMPEPFRWKYLKEEMIDLGRSVAELDTVLKLAINSFNVHDSEFETLDRPLYLLYRLRELRLRLMEQKKKNPRMISRTLLNESLIFLKGLLVVREKGQTEFLFNDAFVERLIRLGEVVSPYEDVPETYYVGMEFDLFNSINRTTNVMASHLIAHNQRLFDTMDCSVIFEYDNVLCWKLIEKALYEVLLMDLLDSSIESIYRFEKGHKLLALAKAEIIKFHAFDYQTAWKMMGMLHRALLKQPNASEIAFGAEAMLMTLSKFGQD